MPPKDIALAVETKKRFEAAPGPHISGAVDMAGKKITNTKKPTSDAVEILHRRYSRENPKAKLCSKRRGRTPLSPARFTTFAPTPAYPSGNSPRWSAPPPR